MWDTDIEIFAAASLLSTDIYVYGSAGTKFTWNKFSRSVLNGLLPQNACSIYIQNTSRIHYDVVLTVGANSDAQNLNRTRSIYCSSEAHFLNKKHVKIEKCVKQKELSAASCPSPK